MTARDLNQIVLCEQSKIHSLQDFTFSCHDIFIVTDIQLNYFYHDYYYVTFQFLFTRHTFSLSAQPFQTPGSLSHSECSSPSLITPPQSPLNLETSSFASTQSQSSVSTLPRISVSPVPMGERRKDRYNTFTPLRRSSVLHTAFT